MHLSDSILVSMSCRDIDILGFLLHLEKVQKDVTQILLSQFQHKSHTSKTKRAQKKSSCITVQSDYC